MKNKEIFLKNLTTLLLSIFSADEFRRFIRYYPSNDDLENLLHGPIAPPALLVSDGIKIFYSRDVINDQFFDKLIEERPGRRDEIENLRNQMNNE